MLGVDRYQERRTDYWWSFLEGAYSLPTLAVRFLLNAYGLASRILAQPQNESIPMGRH